jgi:hypothetical protein
MAKIIRYQKTIKMEPRDGVKYSTTYLKQTQEQRMVLTKHVRTVTKEIADLLEFDPTWNDWLSTPLKGFKTTTGHNRTPFDIISDMVNEAKGKQRNGLPKDYAMAPIERWNKLFDDTDYAVELVQTWGPAPNKFNDLIEGFSNDGS